MSEINTTTNNKRKLIITYDSTNILSLMIKKMDKDSIKKGKKLLKKLPKMTSDEKFAYIDQKINDSLDSSKLKLDNSRSLLELCAENPEIVLKIKDK